MKLLIYKHIFPYWPISNYYEWPIYQIRTRSSILIHI